MLPVQVDIIIVWPEQPWGPAALGAANKHDSRGTEAARLMEKSRKQQHVHDTEMLRLEPRIVVIMDSPVDHILIKSGLQLSIILVIKYSTN